MHFGGVELFFELSVCLFWLVVVMMIVWNAGIWFSWR